MESNRLAHLQAFYACLSRLAKALGGPRSFDDYAGVEWPKRGVYFFFERGEDRSDTGAGLRVVRVGTHALGAGSCTKRWTRLSQHRGQVGSGGGIIAAQSFGSSSERRFIKQGGHACETWGIGCAAQREVRDGELALERAVSKVIRAMPFLWLAVDDEPGPQSQRGYIERNAIALLSNRSWPLGAER